MITEKLQNITLHNCDCMEYLRSLPDKCFDLAIVDPPFFKGVASSNFYGSDISSSNVKRKSLSSTHWDENIPNELYHKELIRVSNNQIIWGINYFDFSNKCGCGRLIWDKKNDTSTFSNCEIASISLINSVKIYRQMWNGMIREGEKEERWHPTQKPIKLYEWILRNYAKKGDKILDTHLGSGSIAIACHNGGFELTACELDEEYFKNAVNRIKEHQKQIRLF